MNLFWFLHKNGALNGRSEFRRLVCMGKIYVNSVPIKFDEHYNLELKENDIVSIGEYQRRVWVV